MAGGFRKWVFVQLLHRFLHKPPDLLIGSPGMSYLRRWHVIPRNPLCNIYLHQFLRSDDDRALHDHPWSNVTWVLEGLYKEHTATGAHWRMAGDVVARRAKTAHRIELSVDPASRIALPCWTLFVTGPRLRDWGFHCPNGWRHWRVFTQSGDPGRIGRGCD
jgi:hypothetical protein